MFDQLFRFAGRLVGMGRLVGVFLIAFIGLVGCQSTKPKKGRVTIGDQRLDFRPQWYAFDLKEPQKLRKVRLHTYKGVVKLEEMRVHAKGRKKPIKPRVPSRIRPGSVVDGKLPKEGVLVYRVDLMASSSDDGWLQLYGLLARESAVPPPE